MAPDGLVGPASGLEIGRLNLLQGDDGPAQVGRRAHDVFDDAGNVEETDAPRQKGRNRDLIRCIEHHWRKPSQGQSFPSET